MQLWTWQLWASEWSPRPPWSELCSGFLSLKPLFKGVKDIVIFIFFLSNWRFNYFNSGWYSLVSYPKWQMSADTSSSAGLSRCWDLCVPQHLSSASQQRMQRRIWRKDCMVWGKHLEGDAVTEVQSTLVELCWWEVHSPVLALCCQVSVILTMVTKNTLNRRSNWFSWTGKRYNPELRREHQP